jgi:hypothetical protein
VWRLDQAISRADRALRLGPTDFHGGRLRPRRLALSPDGNWLVVSFAPAARSGLTEQWCTQEPQAGTLLVVGLSDEPSETWVDTGFCSYERDIEIAFSSDGRLFAAGGDPAVGAARGPGRVRTWTVRRAGLADAREPVTLSEHASRVFEVALADVIGRSALGVGRGRPHRLLLAAGDYGELDLWDLDDQVRPVVRRVDSLPIYLLAQTASGGMIAAADRSHGVRLWPATAEQSAEPIHLSSPADASAQPGFLAFGGTGEWLASAAWQRDLGGVLTVWDLDIKSLSRKACALWRHAGENGDAATDVRWSDERGCQVK